MSKNWEVQVFPHPFQFEATPGTDLAGRCYMHNPSKTTRVRIVVILWGIVVVIDLEIP
jgi:hypothetical protein